MKPRGKTCEAAKGLLEEGSDAAADFKGSPAINAAIVAAVQKVEHYEMASYDCPHEWARLLGKRGAAARLQQILDEEKDADESPTELARASSNEEALGESDAKSSKGLTEKKPLAVQRGVQPAKPARNRTTARAE